MTAEVPLGKSTRVRTQLIAFVSVLFVVMTYTAAGAQSPLSIGIAGTKRHHCEMS